MPKITDENAVLGLDARAFLTGCIWAVKKGERIKKDKIAVSIIFNFGDDLEKIHSLAREEAVKFMDCEIIQSHLSQLNVRNSKIHFKEGK